MTIEQDENYVKFEPVITSNVEYVRLDFYLNNYQKRINIGDYIPKDAYLIANFYLKNNVDELTVFTFNGVNIGYRRSSVDDTAFNINQIYNYDFPQEVNITIDEYIRYEDIVQPYPSLLRFNDENGNEVSWGGKFKVGSTITRIGSAADSNLLPNIYNIFGLLLNGNQVTSSKVIVEKTMVFKAKSAYIFDNNEPKCILSPRLLRIPNSSYKILGHIPDISGHGNNGVIHNSAYAGTSGANGYPYDYNNSSFWCDSILAKVVSGELVEYFAVKNSTGFSNITSGVYKGEIKVTGVTKAISENKISRLRIYTNSTTDNELIDITQDGNYNIDIKGVGDANRVFFYAIPNNPNESIVVRLTEPVYIEQVGNYEGSICFDGVDDFVTIPTTVGGKQVLMKVNSRKSDCYLYDQRNNWEQYLGIVSTKDFIAYNYSNQRGKTYIDGILNENITANDLIGITHNITVTNNRDDVKQYSPCIGTSFARNSYAQMALYDFMLFDNISTDDKIKQLNEYVGIEGNFVEWNPTITTNISSTYTISPNIRKSDGITVKLVKGNIYSTSITGNLVLDIVPPNKDLDEVTNVIIDGKSYTPIKYQYADYYRVEIPLVFPQEINITIDEYIRYESIEQPYPIFLNYIDKETNKTYTWGDKVKVDSILKISGYKNLFENGDTSLGGSNGYSVNGSSELIALGTLLTSEILVNKINTGVRSSVIWNLNTPKPLFAYDPSIINNVGLKNLGYLPDITGQGRHLLLDGFAYEGMSGVNGYPVVFGENKTWEAQGTKDGDKYYIYTSNANKFNITQIKISSSLFYTYIKRNGELTSGNKDISSFNLKVTGLNYDKFYLAYYYLKSADVEVRNVINITSDGIYELPKSFASDGSLTETNSYIGLSFIRKSSEIPDVIQNVNVTIEALPNYEGSLYFDGVNDKGTVQNLTYGGKCLISKVNFEFNQSSIILYDQRATASSGENNNTFALLASKITEDIAYGLRLTGNTYINNVLNNYIRSSELENIEHTLTMTSNVVSEKNSVTPVFGCSVRDVDYAKFAMYKTILLSEIPTTSDRETINNWCGLPTGYLPKPEYYWDAYGKSNLDADKGYIKDQVSLQLNNDTTNNNSLENFNFGYEGMSGYNGYPVIFGANKTWKNKAPEGPNSYICTINANKYNITQILLSNAWTYSYIKENGELTKYNKDVESFKIKVTGLKSEIPLRYSYLSSTDATVTSNITIKSDGTYELPKSFANDGSLIDNYGWIGFSFTRISVDIPEIITDVNITIEILPEYKNGLVYDGVDDYSENASIPLLSDYTYIFKRTLLNKKYNSASIFKGSNQQSGGGAFICDYNSVEPDLLTQGYSFGAGLYVDSLNADSIVYGTRGSVNGTKITAGNNTDTEGLTVGKWRAYKEMVFYKLFLYPRTVNMLSINMVKNMMEEDGIIDLTSKLFTDKYTGDFYEMDFNNDFLIGN